MLRLCKQQFCSISEDVNLEMKMSRESIFVALKSGLSQSSPVYDPTNQADFWGIKL